MQVTYHRAGDDGSLGRNPRVPAVEGEAGGGMPDAAEVAAACALVGDRWSLPIVAALAGGPLRYGEIRGRLEQIAPNILSARLKSLEHGGLLTARRYSTRPARFEYALTADGEGLLGAVHALAGWWRRTEAGEPDPVHEECGTPLELRWWCPSCGIPAAESEDEAAFTV